MGKIIGIKFDKNGNITNLKKVSKTQTSFLEDNFGNFMKRIKSPSKGEDE